MVLLAQVGTVQAAPIPGTSTSSLVSEQPGQYWSKKGFKMNSGQTSWQQKPPPKHIESLVTVYRAPARKNGQQPALTVRVDELQRPQTLQKYVKKWMKDYARFGFDILTAKPIKLKDNQAFLLDLVSRETERQLRQVVLLKDKTSVILTCRDHRDTFAKTVLECNEIIKTFEWVKDVE